MNFTNFISAGGVVKELIINDGFIRNLIVFYGPIEIKKREQYINKILRLIKNAKNVSHDDAWRINLALASPNFRIMLVFDKDLPEIYKNIGASYNSQEHHMLVVIDQEVTFEIILHEFNHVYNTIIHSEAFWPGSIEEKKYATFPYQTNHNFENARGQVLGFIDEFKNSVYKFWQLNKKFNDNGPLSDEEKLLFNHYNSAIQNMRSQIIPIIFDPKPDDYEINKIVNLSAYVEENGYIFNSVKSFELKAKIHKIVQKQESATVYMEFMDKNDALLYFAFNTLPGMINDYVDLFSQIDQFDQALITHIPAQEGVAMIHSQGQPIINAFAPGLARYEWEDAKRWLDTSSKRKNIPSTIQKLITQREEDINLQMEEPMPPNDEINSYFGKAQVSSSSQLLPFWKRIPTYLPFNFRLGKGPDSPIDKMIRSSADKNLWNKYAESESNTPDSVQMQFGFWFASKVGGIKKPLRPLENLNFTSTLSEKAYSNNIKMQAAIRKLKKLGFEMEEVLGYLFGKYYTEEDEKNSIIRDFFVDILVGDIDREVGLTFDSAANIHNELERWEKLHALVSDYVSEDCKNPFKIL